MTISRAAVALGAFSGLTAAALVAAAALLEPASPAPAATPVVPAPAATSSAPVSVSVSVSMSVEHDPAWQPRCPSPLGWQAASLKGKRRGTEGTEDTAVAALRSLAVSAGGDRVVMTSSPQAAYVLAVVAAGEGPLLHASAHLPRRGEKTWQATVQYECEPLAPRPAWVEAALGKPTCGHVHASHVSKPAPGDRDAQVRTCFESAVAAGVPAGMAVHTLTTEGDPISRHLRYDGTALDVVLDTTSDGFGARRWTLTRCSTVGPPPDFLSDLEGACVDITPST